MQFINVFLPIDVLSFLAFRQPFRAGGFPRRPSSPFLINEVGFVSSHAFVRQVTATVYGAAGATFRP